MQMLCNLVMLDCDAYENSMKFRVLPCIAGHTLSIIINKYNILCNHC